MKKGVITIPTTKKMKKLIEFFGSETEIGNLLGITSAAVYNWVKQGYVPPMSAIRIEELSEGRIKAADITKDLKPNKKGR